MKTTFSLKKSPIAAVCAMVMLVSSCGSAKLVPAEEEYNNAWKGRTHAEIVQTYGAPNRSESDGQGGIILVYETVVISTTTSSNAGLGMYAPDHFTSRSSSSEQYVHFFLDSNDYCYLVKTNKALPGGQREEQIRRNMYFLVGGALAASLLIIISGTMRVHSFYM